MYQLIAKKAKYQPGDVEIENMKEQKKSAKNSQSTEVGRISTKTVQPKAADSQRSTRRR